MATVHPSPCQSIQKEWRRLLRHLHQSVRPREHHSDVSASSSTSGTRARLRSIRRCQDLPGLADLLFGIAVSPCSQPLSPLCRFPPLAPLATPTEARRRCALSPPWLEPTSAASERVTVLSTFAGAPSTPPLDLPCTTTPVPSATELRPPPAIVAPSSPASSRPAACSVGCGTRLAARRAKPRVERSPDGESRAPPPPCLVAGG